MKKRLLWLMAAVVMAAGAAGCGLGPGTAKTEAMVVGETVGGGGTDQDGTGAADGTDQDRTGAADGTGKDGAGAAADGTGKDEAGAAADGTGKNEAGAAADGTGKGEAHMAADKAGGKEASQNGAGKEADGDTGRGSGAATGRNGQNNAGQNGKEKAEAAQQGGKEAEDSGFVMGSWDGLTFTNPWLDVEVSFPQGSHVFSGEEMEAILGTSQEILINSGDGDNRLKPEEAWNVYDFMVTLPDGRSNVQMVYQNVEKAGMSRDMTAEEYLAEISGELAAIDDMRYEIGEPREVKIGEQTFLKLSADLMGGTMYQEYYTIRKGSYMATLTISYLPDARPAVEELEAGMTAAGMTVTGKEGGH